MAAVAFSHVYYRTGLYPLKLPHGIILVTGTTGSGKTSTLYTALAAINDYVRKIITIEDPVEYQLKGVNQIQVNEKSGLTFARGLRSILDLLGAPPKRHTAPVRRLAASSARGKQNRRKHKAARQKMKRAPCTEIGWMMHQLAAEGLGFSRAVFAVSMPLMESAGNIVCLVIFWPLKAILARASLISVGVMLTIQPNCGFQPGRLRSVGSVGSGEAAKVLKGSMML